MDSVNQNRRPELQESVTAITCSFDNFRAA